jgi:1-acyl-sn-glycerol-3-phosphate acyltransferase
MDWLASRAVTGFARVLTGVRPEWRGCKPDVRQRIYFANHASHGDFVLIWSVLPKELRDRTRPVAGADYWRAGRLRHFFGQNVFKAVLIERGANGHSEEPILLMSAALDEGSSLIIFPEGTRNVTDADLLPFKSGIYNLAVKKPNIELIPTWIDNISRVLPKGEFLPVPLLCSVTFGEPIMLNDKEERLQFLERARSALLALKDGNSRSASISSEAKHAS